ncbi:MAG TPA: ATP-binding cassette domain-containing protein [Patescibacteria group bacterium]|nr:ATP-binding cassette domain-containing protein [Patescibacteria group bacterium]
MEVLAEAGDIPLRRVDEVLELVGLSEVANKRPGKFSLGMSQRLGIAAAILGKPKYLMLDEPANGLDPEGIAWLRQFLKDYADQNNAVFVSSHLLSEMSQMADNVIVIGRGRLIAETSMQSLISGSSHASVFVRAASISQLEKLFKVNAWEYEKEQGGLRAAGVKSDAIGKAAFAAGLALLELAPTSASLEEAFLELTAGSEEYQAKTEAKK